MQKNDKKWKNDKNAKNGFLGFRRRRAKIVNSRFFGKSVFWVFQEKGCFFEKGILGVLGGGSKIGVFWEGVKNRPNSGFFQKCLKISILGVLGVFCRIRGFRGYIGEMP